MANKDDYLTQYRKFFEYFAETVNPHDQLPVKLACYKLVNVEVVGGIIDWTTQYLTQKQCPESLIAPLIKIVIDEIRKACKKHPIACGFNTSDEAYEPLKLMQCVMAKTNEVCLRYLDNSMLCSLPSPGPPYNMVSVFALKNLRRKMEDRHVVVHDLNTMFNIQQASPSSYYAVFDGHAGHDAAAYSSAHLHQFLAESKHFIHNPEQALIDAFCKTDALFIDKCRVEKLSSGTTAVCALLRPKEKLLYIAWVGDSQALLVNQGKVLQCVAPHKPSREDEKSRIEQQGGLVLYWGTWRVNGQLAVSRAIGDAEYKPYVTATPDVQEIPLSGDEDFLILACDGLWDFLSEDDAACAVYNMVCNNPDDTESISHHLAQLAKQQGSTDNISVIVVFLREPSKVAADAHWANRNRLTMEAGLDNANATNNPFANSNGTEILQQKDGFLLNLTEGFKQNGAELSPSNEYAFERPANGKRSAEEFDEDEDMGPETDVDAVDDALLSPATEQGIIDNKNIEGFDPFTTEIEEKATLEMDLDIQKQQTSEFEPPRTPREETPTPPADEVHDAGVVENVADSGEDSEDEWNYYKGDSAESEKVSSSKADQEVAELTKTVEEDEDAAMSQLNPNAAEFVPISSPTRNVVSPACRALIDDEVIAQSPRRATPSDIDINLPNPQDFEKEVKNRPSDVYSNGQEDDEKKLSSQEVMENLLNGRNIEDIEFHPGTPHKAGNTEEFHFGPNATPFSTPAKLLDQSEAALSTKAVLGDESSYLEGKTLDFESSFATEDTSNANPFKTCDDVCDFQPQLSKPDPMSMSFYQDESETNPFDLNKVQMLPDDDEFLEKQDNNGGQFNDTISDLPEHNPLPQNERVTTDLDRLAEACDTNLIYGVSKLPETPEPEIQADEGSSSILTCDFPPAKSPILMEASQAPLPLTPEPNSDEPEVVSDAISPSPQEDLVYESNASPTPSKSPILIPEFAAHSDLLKKSSATILEDTMAAFPSAFRRPSEPTELERELAISPEPVDIELCQQTLVLGRPESKSPSIRTPEPTEEFLCQSKSPEPADLDKSPVLMLEPEVIEKEEKAEEFFPICQKSSEQKDIVEEIQQVIKEGYFFPLCQKSTEQKDIVEEIQEVMKEEEFFPICQKPTQQKDIVEEIQEVVKEEEFFVICSKPVELPVVKDAYQEEPLKDNLQEFELSPANRFPGPWFIKDDEILQTKSSEAELEIQAKSPELEIELQTKSPELKIELQTKSPEPEIAIQAETHEPEIEVPSKSPELEMDLQAKSPEPEIAIQAKTYEPEIEIPSKSPELKIEFQTKSPEPEIAIQAKTYEPEIAIQAETHEPEIEVPSKSSELEIELQTKSPEPEIAIQAETYEPEIELQTKSFEPEIERHSKSPEPEIEFQTKLHEPEIEIQAKTPEPEIEIQTKSPEPEIEIQRKSPEPEIDIQAKLTQPEIEIQAKSPEPEIEIQAKSLELEVQAKSPEPDIEDQTKTLELDIQIPSKSPEPVDTLIQTITKTPEPTSDIIESEVKEDEKIKSEEVSRTLGPILDNLQDIQTKLVEFSQDVPLLEPNISFVCEKQIVEECLLPITESRPITTETDDLPQTHEPEVVKKNETEVCKTPESMETEIKLHEPKEIIETSDQLLVDEIQHILDTVEPTALPIESEAKSPETIEESLDSEKRDLESPMEDITSSVKDDNSLTPEIIEEAKDISTEKELIKDSFVQLNEPSVGISNITQETEAIIEKETVCQISSTPNTTLSEQLDTESVNTAEINSFLERSNIPEVTSPLSPGDPLSQQIIDATLSKPVVSPVEDVIKTELIAPQYPEETTIVTPSEETKAETLTITSEQKEAPAALPEVASEAETKGKVDEAVVAAAVGTAAAVATTAAVAAAVKDKKTIGKPSAKLQPLAKKPSKPGQTPTKTATTKSIPTTKTPTTTKSSVPSPTKPVPSKTAKAPAPKPAATQKPAAKPLTKPRTETTATKTIEKKHAAMNGDVKLPAPIKRPSALSAKTPLTAKSPVAPKPSPIKSETKTTAATTRTSTTRTSLTSATTRSTAGTGATKTTTAAPKPRPTSLSSKSTGSSTTKSSSTVSATKTTVQSRVSTTASSPKSTTAKLKPPTSLVSKSPTANASPRPKLSMTKTKEPDTEKQIKESVNKQLTATSRTTTTKTTGTLSAGKTTTTVKKTETKSPSTRTTATTKTTVTTLKSTAKKPTEITRIIAKRTAPTKTTTIKAQQNGLINGVTTTTIVQETTTILATEPQLIKDLSPVENKLIIDNQLSETNVAD